MGKKVNVNVLVDDFRHWLDKYMQGWDDEGIYECTTDYSSIIDNNRVLNKFLDEYPQYDMDILNDNRDELGKAVMRIAWCNSINW